MLSKRYKSTVVDRRTWLLVPLKVNRHIMIWTAALSPLVGIIFMAIPFPYDFTSKIIIKEKQLPKPNKLTK